jgi:hypothetical protein
MVGDFDNRAGIFVCLLVLHMALSRAFWAKEKPSLDIGPSGSAHIIP